MARTPKSSASLSRADIPRHFFSRLLPEFRPVRMRACEHPGCEGVGEYKAPARHWREEVQASPLNIIDERREACRWFCLDHVRAYNAQWDYYEGLNEHEIEAAIRFDAVWNRPSWRFGQWGPRRGQRPEAQNQRSEKNGESDQESLEEEKIAPLLAAAHEALAEFGLQPPVEFAEVKKRYRDLVKQHHPDLKNGAAEEAEEKIKRLNAAFALLKSFYLRRKNA